MLELRNAYRSGGGGILLDGASLSVPAGEPLSVLGLTSGGRRDLGRLLAGADRPEKGTATLSGRDLHRARRDRGGRAVVLVSSPPAVSGAASVRRAVTSAGAGQERSDTLLMLAGLADGSARVRDLGSADRARLALACALARAPSLLVVDSPGDHLPVADRETFLSDAARLVAGAGGGGVVVWLAAEGEEAAVLGGRSVILHRGRVEQDGPAADVAAHPVTLAAARAVAGRGLNTLDLAISGGVARLPDGSTLAPPTRLALPSNGPATIAFRPDDLAPDRRGDDAIRFVVRVEGASADGRHARVSFAGATWLMPPPAQLRDQGLLLNAFVAADRLMAFGQDGRLLGG